MTEARYALNRRSERKPVQIAVTLVIKGDEADQAATALDLSQHGVRLQSALSLAPGQRVGLLLSDRPNCVIRARVVWLGKADSEESAHAGLEFLRPLPAPV